MKTIDMKQLAKLERKQLELSVSTIEVELIDRTRMILVDKVFSEEKLEAMAKETFYWLNNLINHHEQGSVEFNFGFEIVGTLPYIMVIKYFTNLEVLEDMGTPIVLQKIEYYMRALSTLMTEEWRDRKTGLTTFQLIMSKVSKSELTKLTDRLYNVLEEIDLDVSSFVDSIEQKLKSDVM